MKLKNGDIVLNRWAGRVEGRYFIYTGTSGRMVKGISMSDGKLSTVEYYKSSLDAIHYDGKPAFQIVGKSSVFDVMVEELGKYQKEGIGENGDM